MIKPKRPTNMDVSRKKSAAPAESTVAERAVKEAADSEIREKLVHTHTHTHTHGVERTDGLAWALGRVRNNKHSAEHHGENEDRGAKQQAGGVRRHEEKRMR
jgi:hypothetical protein